MAGFCEEHRRAACGRAGCDGGRSGDGPTRGERADRGRPAPGRVDRVPAAVPALAAVLPEPGRGAAAAAGWRSVDRRHVPLPAPRQRGRLDLDLRPQPDHRPRTRTRDRLQPVHRLTLSRGDRKGWAGPCRDAPHDGDRGPHGVLLVADGRGRAGVTARPASTLSLLDGPRWSDRRIACGPDRVDRAARRSHAARPPRQLAEPALLAPTGGGRSASHRVELLVSAVTVRDETAAADCDRERVGPDHCRDPVPANRVHLGRRADPATVGQRAPGRRRGACAVSALPRYADHRRRQGRRSQGGVRCALTVAAGTRASRP